MNWFNEPAVQSSSYNHGNRSSRTSLNYKFSDQTSAIRCRTSSHFNFLSHQVKRHRTCQMKFIHHCSLSLSVFFFFLFYGFKLSMSESMLSYFSVFFWFEFCVDYRGYFCNYSLWNLGVWRWKLKRKLLIVPLIECSHWLRDLENRLVADVYVWIYWMVIRA